MRGYDNVIVRLLFILKEDSHMDEFYNLLDKLADVLAQLSELISQIDFLSFKRNKK
jgi:hypothetical protein